MTQSELLNRTRKLAGESKMTHEQLANATGLNKWWMAKFRQGAINNPGILTVQKLHDWLVANR